ncbi:MAG: DinB family protein [Cryomorphaceae bacterium]
MLPELDALQRSAYFDTYLEHLVSDDLAAELIRSSKELEALISPLSGEQMEFRYAPEKWSVRQVVQHLIDTELIFNYRALRIGREVAPQKLDGFDENEYANRADLSNLTNSELLEFFTSTRQSTCYLAKTFSEAQLERVGIASGHRIQVKALFYITAGHALHHANVIRERYLQA